MPYTTTTSDEQSAAVLYNPLRTWIPLVILPLMLFARFIPDLWPNGPSSTWMFSAFGPFLLGVVILAWWLILSRARWTERLFGLTGLVAILVLEQTIAHFSMRGPLLIVMTIPMAVAAFAIGLVIFGKQLTARRTVLALVLAAMAASVSLFLRTDGVWGDFSFGLFPRWGETAEEKMLAKSENSPTEPTGIPATETLVSAWPKFRGANQDGVQHGEVFDADWQANPPKELWRIEVGPAWSSFIAVGKYLVTQEQRGENEAIVCYDSENGQKVWTQSWTSRFFEGLGGLGPRSTPTFEDGYIYALGAEGWLVKLDAHQGDLVWKIDIKEAAKRTEPPMWGFSASPLVHNGLVIVHAGGKDDRGVLAFNTNDGKLAWSVAAGEQSYGSVQVVQALGKTMLALLSEKGAHFWDPTNGNLLLDYSWDHNGYRSLQPQIIDGDKLLIPTGQGTGTRLVQLKEKEGALSGEVLWTSKELKPDFNDVLVHLGYIYGFDNRIFACLNLETGKRVWKGGHYEKGQALLLADSNLIVVVTERGELVLLKTNPEKLEELAKIPAVEGKTWNHPMIIGDKLFVRNANEAVCFQLGLHR